MRKKLALIATTVALASLIVAGGTLAYFQKSSAVYDNKINVAKGIDGNIIDEFDENQKLIPGGSVDKKVGLKVEGSFSAFGRINVKMFWTDINGDVPLNLGTSKNDLKVSNTWLKADTADGNIDDTKWTLANVDTSNKNVVEYTYNYKGEIKPTDPAVILFNCVELKPGVEFGNQYSKKTLHVVVSGDLIQATGNTEATAWDGYVPDQREIGTPSKPVK